MQVGSSTECMATRNNSVPLCGSCDRGLSEVVGSERCRECHSVAWWWMVLPVPL